MEKNGEKCLNTLTVGCLGTSDTARMTGASDVGVNKKNRKCQELNPSPCVVEGTKAPITLTTGRTISLFQVFSSINMALFRIVMTVVNLILFFLLCAEVIHD